MQTPTSAAPVCHLLSTSCAPSWLTSETCRDQTQFDCRKDLEPCLRLGISAGNQKLSPGEAGGYGLIVGKAVSKKQIRLSPLR